jgi:hypothetical protein
VLKSTNHFRAEFEKIAAEILYVAPPDVFSSVPFTRIARPKWPLDPTRSPTSRRRVSCRPTTSERAAIPADPPLGLPWRPAPLVTPPRPRHPSLLCLAKARVERRPEQAQTPVRPGAQDER